MGEELDNRTDLFSLGVVLYQMLCGKLPHEGRGHELLRKNMVVQAPPISARVPGLVVDPVLEAIALRLMAKNPAERFQSGQEVVKLLVDSSLVRMDSRKAGESRITLLRVSEPVPEPHALGASGAVPMAANQSGAFTPVPMMASQSGAFTPAPMMASPSGGFASPAGNVGMIPSLAPRAGTMPPVIIGAGTSAPVPQAGPTLTPGQQWTRPPTQGDGTVHVRVPGGANTNRIRILIAATVGMLGIIIAILLYQKFTPKEGENSASSIDAGVDAPIGTQVDGHPTPLVADAGASAPDAQEPADAAIPDARTRIVTNGQRPRKVTRGDFKKRYIEVGRLVNQLLDARRGWPKATRLQERYLKIEYEDALDDATLRRIEHKKLGRLKTDIKKHLPRK